MNHTLSGSDENWQRQIEERVAQRMRHERAQREADDIRLQYLRQNIGNQLQREAMAGSRALVWGGFITAMVVGIVAAIALFQHFHF